MKLVPVLTSVTVGAGQPPALRVRHGTFDDAGRGLRLCAGIEGGGQHEPSREHDLESHHE